MDWSKVKASIGTIAPWLAGTLGSPVAGVAVKALCDVLGLRADASPAQVADAVAGAGMEQLKAVRDADDVHREFMAQIGYDSIAKLEAIAAEDRADARRMQVNAPSKWPGALSLVLTVAVLGIIAASLAGVALPQDVMAQQLVGSLTTAWGVSLTYWFGTTRGSTEKNALLAQSQPGA